MKGQHFLKFFVLGFLIATSVNFIHSCSDKSSPTDPKIEEDSYTESDDLKNLSKNLVSAFKEEDKTKVITFLIEDSKEIYAELINNSDESLSAFGSALEKRKLIFSNDLYAEYEITINEEVYTISYGNSGDGNWQLLRF